MASFANPADLEIRLKKTFSAQETDQAEQLLAGATAKVRALTDQWISEVVGDVFTTSAPASRVLWLPQRPVTAVASVELDGVAVTGWVRRGSRLIRTCPWAAACEEVELEVVYSHGYAADDERLDLAKDYCLAYAAQGMSNPNGYQSEKIDDYARTFGKESGWDAVEKALCRQYGRRPKTGSINTAA